MAGAPGLGRYRVWRPLIDDREAATVMLVVKPCDEEVAPASRYYLIQLINDTGVHEPGSRVAGTRINLYDKRVAPQGVGDRHPNTRTRLPVGNE